MISLSWFHIFLGPLILLALFGDIVCGGVENFNVVTSRANLRAGDQFDVICAADSVEVLNFRCGSLEYLSFVNINDSEIKVLNNTAIYFTEKDAKPKHRTDHYICQCKKNELWLTKSNYLVGVKLKIKESDLECVYREYAPDAQFECEFKRPEYSDVDEPNTSYYLREENNNETRCTFVRDSMEPVRCTLPASRSIKFQGVNLQLRMRDSIGDQYQNFSRRDRIEYLVISAPNEEFDVTNSNTSSVCVKWRNDQKSNTYEIAKEWSIELNSSTYDSYREVTATANYEGLCFDNLPYPNQMYNITAKRRLSNNTAHWSSSMTFDISKIKTKPTIPGRPPTVWPGGFYSRVLDRKRELHVYWQKLDPLEYNGPDFEYDVNAYNIQEQRYINKSTIEAKLNVAIIRNLEASSGPYIITIGAKNSEGLSKQSSQIWIPRLDAEDDRRLKNITFCSKTMDSWCWQPPAETKGLLGYTVYYCASSKRGSNCNNSVIETTPVYNNSFYSEHVKNDSYDWAVSPIYEKSSDGATGGMFWVEEHPVYYMGKEYITDSSHTLEGMLALVVLAVCLYLLYRRVQHMSDIGIVLPDGVLPDTAKEEQTIVPFIQEPSNRSEAAEKLPPVVSGHIMPLEASVSLLNPPTVEKATTSTADTFTLQMSEPSTANQCDMPSGYVPMQKMQAKTAAKVSQGNPNASGYTIMQTSSYVVPSSLR